MERLLVGREPGKAGRRSALGTSSAARALRGFNINSNHAELAGGGVYCTDGLKILDSNIKHNTVDAVGGAGGIYAAADSVCFSNISHNQNYNLMVAGTDDLLATRNWWNTRSNEVVIEGGIFDRHDTIDPIGLVDFSSYLTDVSVTTPGRFTQVTEIAATDDGTYQTPLAHTVVRGDSLFFMVRGIDDNVFNRDVVVAMVANLNSGVDMRPFFEESGDNTGEFECFLVLGDHDDEAANTIAVSAGDKLRVLAQISPQHHFDLVVGAVAPVIAAFDVEGDLQAPGATVSFLNLSTGSATDYMWSFGDGDTSTEPSPQHVYATGGQFNVTLLVSGVDSMTWHRRP